MSRKEGVVLMLRRRWKGNSVFNRHCTRLTSGNSNPYSCSASGFRSGRRGSRKRLNSCVSFSASFLRIAIVAAEFRRVVPAQLKLYHHSHTYHSRLSPAQRRRRTLMFYGDPHHEDGLIYSWLHTIMLYIVTILFT